MFFIALTTGGAFLPVNQDSSRARVCSIVYEQEGEKTLQFLGLKFESTAKRVVTLLAVVAIIFSLIGGVNPAPVSASTENALSVVSASTDSLGKRITVEFDQPMADPTGKQDQFLVKINDAESPVTAVSPATNDKQIILTLLKQMPYSSSTPQVITLNYTMGSVTAADGTPLPSFTDVEVVNKRLGLELVDYEPAATEIACDDDGDGGKILKYRCDNLFDYDNVNLALYFCNGFFRNFEDNLKNYVKFYEKDTGITVELPNVVTVGIENGSLPKRTWVDGTERGYMEITDWYFWQVSGGAPLGLALKSTALKPSTTYVVEVQKGFAFHAGPVKNSYFFEFTTTADSQTKPYWVDGSSLTTSGLTDTGLTLEWPAAQDNHGVDYNNLHYNIYQNGTLLTTVSGDTSSYDVTNLSPATEYQFRLEAVDFANNLSTNNLETTVKTSGSITPLPAPSLAADSSDNTVGNAVDLAFADDAVWRSAISGITVNGTALTTGQYTVSEGNINITADVFDVAADYAIVVSATGYTDAIVEQAMLLPAYTITPTMDVSYTNGTTVDGITTMSVNEGVSGLNYFRVQVMPVRAHNGQEAVVFVHFRNGMQESLNVSKADFDIMHNAAAGFNVQAGDLVKVYVVDDLTNATDFNPTIFN